jgi:hypothetical protein
MMGISLEQDFEHDLTAGVDSIDSPESLYRKL